MTDWDLLTPGIGLTSIGIVGVGISLAGVAKTFIDGMHAVSLLTMFIGMIFLASGLFKDGFPSTGRAKSATFITLGFLVTFGVAAAVTVSAQVPSIYAYIGIMLIISIPAAVLAVAAFKRVAYLKALAVIFISGSIVSGTTFYAFGLVAPKPPVEEPEEETPEQEVPLSALVNAKILAGASAQNNPDYEPDTLSVNIGDSVSWFNEDNVPHTVTSKQEGLFDSSIIAANATWVLNTGVLSEGSYEFFCTLHPFMESTLNIGAAQPEQAVTPAENNTSSEGAGLGVNQTGPSESGVATVTSVSIVVGSSVPTNNEFFVPETVQNTVGSLVRWENQDSVPHTVTSGVVESNAPKPDGTFDSGILNKGQTFSYVFDKPREYDYFCLLHPFMTGKVIVE